MRDVVRNQTQLARRRIVPSESSSNSPVPKRKSTWFSGAHLSRIWAKRPAKALAIIAFLGIGIYLVATFAAGSETTNFAATDFTGATKSNVIVDGSGNATLATATGKTYYVSKSGNNADGT